MGNDVYLILTLNINLRIKDFDFLKSFQNVYISHMYV